MSLRTPLAVARGLGSAKEGVDHWWKQRLTAVALAPLGLWLGFTVALMGTADYYTVTAWLAHPVNAVLMMFALALGFWHGGSGVQVVIEDYVATTWKKIALIVAVQLAALVSGLSGVFAVIQIAAGA